MHVVFTPLAERQIDELHRYITTESGFESRADAYIERIVDYCLRLETFPEPARSRNDLIADHHK